MNDHLALHARQLGSEITSADGRWMFAPGGVHTISCGAGDGGIAELTLRIDEHTPAVLNASLAKINAENHPQRAYFDKEHDKHAGATAWPKTFYWSETPQPGVYSESDVTSFGRDLVSGKVVRAFSPSFYADAALPKKVARGQRIGVKAGARGSAENPARMIGLVFPDCGTLTNDPAFRKILPLWAKNAGTPSTANHNTKQTMKLTTEEKAALEAKKTSLEQELPALRARAEDKTDAAAANELINAESELDNVSTKLELAASQERAAVLESAVLKQRTKDAKDAVKLAVKRGAIPAADDALQAKWEKRCTEDPENLELLASMKGSPALDRNQSPQRLVMSGVVIGREDSVTVLKAYNVERDPRKKHAIFARDIKSRIKEGEDLPIHASNTLGTLSGEIITQQALELLQLDQPAIGMLSTNFSDLPAQLDQEINTRIVGIPGTTAYNTSTGYATENTVTTDVPVVINTHKSTQVSFNANELASTSRRLFDELAPAMAYAVGKDMIDAALALITTGNFTNTPTTEALIDFTRSTVIAVGGALSDRGVPTMSRTLLLTGSYYDKLFSDDAIVTLAAQQRQDLITGSRMLPLHDFNVLRAPTLPTTGNLTGFGFSKSALVLAARVPNDYASMLPGANGGGVSQVITNSQTGLSVMLVQFVDHQLGAAFSRIAYMYGVAKGQINAGQILRSSA